MSCPVLSLRAVPVLSSADVTAGLQDSEDADDVRDFGLDKETIAALEDEVSSDEDDVDDETIAAYKQHRRHHAKYPPDLSKMARSEQIKDRLERSTHITQPESLSSAICESVEHLKGHVLVCGCPQTIPIFVHTLRPKYIQAEELMPIVFLHTVHIEENTYNKGKWKNTTRLSLPKGCMLYPKRCTRCAGDG